MGLFSRNKEAVVIREVNNAESDILRAIVVDDTLTKDKIMNIPSVSACVNKISDTVAQLKVKLYKRNGDAIEEIEDDPRVFLLNNDTKDTLDGFQFKKAMVMDMYLDKGGYAYINRKGKNIESLHYVKSSDISFRANSDPIFKDYKITCQGKDYEGWDFLKLLRNTDDGYQGKSILKESPELLNIIYSSQLYEKNLVKTGGNKKGFIQSTVKLTREAMTALKEAFRNLYSNNTENVVVLNDGLTFKESTNTSTEMQLNENKRTNADDVCKVFLIPPPILNGGATEADRKAFIDDCILPILERFSTALNRELLAEDEKTSLFFAFDTTDLVKGDIEKRFKSYEIAIKNGFMQVDEVRTMEKLPSFDLDFVKLGLQDVLYFPKSDEVYTPNTNKKVSINAADSTMEGGETEDES